MNDSPRRRAAARDKGLRRAATTTGWVAVGGVAATALAAVVLAQSPAGGATPAADTPAATVAGPTGPDGQATTDPPDTVSAPTTAPSRSRHSSGGSHGQVLRAPATPVVPVAPQGHAHVSSGAS